MVNTIKRNQASPDYLASVSFNKLVYGDDNILAVPSGGTLESVESITMDDLKAFYHKSFSPSVAKMHFVGKIEKDRVLKGLENLSAKWKAIDVDLPEIAAPKLPVKSAIYFVDVPGEFR